MDIKSLLEEEDLQLRKLEDLVRTSIAEEQILSTRLMEFEDESESSFGERLSDRLSSFGGSWTFIIFFFTTLLVWVSVNAGLLMTDPFDPFPFILLNLILSCLAAVQAPIIMMSQNRQDDKDRKRARGDYLINLKAELEVRNLHAKIDLLLTEQMRSLFKTQVVQMEYLERIDQTLARAHGSSNETKGKG